MRGLTVFCAIVMAALIAVPGFAEVQNIKVSGDITLRDFARNGITLDGTLGGDERFFTSTARLRFDADLTDNVSAVLALFNERDWGRDAANQTDVNIEQAYITLKEYFYEPLTIRIGRQPLWFGKGMIVGKEFLLSAKLFWIFCHLLI